jgi:hypothetical protein
VSPIVFIVIVYFCFGLVPLPANFFLFLVLFVAFIIASESFGLLVSCAFNDMSAATAVMTTCVALRACVRYSIVLCVFYGVPSTVQCACKCACKCARVRALLCCVVYCVCLGVRACVRYSIVTCVCLRGVKRQRRANAFVFHAYGRENNNARRTTKIM